MAQVASDMVPWRETEEQAAELAALQRLLDISSGTFSLSIAVCNSPALRDFLIGRVRESHPDLAVVSLPQGTVDIYGEVTGHIGDTNVSAVFVTGIELSVSSESQSHPALKSLNASRDLWESRFNCPVVLWMPEHIAALLPSHASDLWRYRSHGFEFAAPSWMPDPVSGEVIEANLLLSSNLDADQKRFRLAELEQRVNDLGWPPMEVLVPYAIVWMQELGFLYSRVGRFEEAEHIISKSLSLCAENRLLSVKATLLGDLGNIAISRGDLELAGQRYSESLEINRKLDRLEGEAICLGNLGIVSKKRGDLDSAEEYYRRALEIDRRLGRLNGQATQLGNLGNIASARGELDTAEQYYREALEIDRSIGRLEGQAAHIGNLGLIYLQRGDQNEAERLLDEALDLQRLLGWGEGQSSRLAHLGAIKVNRGDLITGEKLLRQSLEIDRRLENFEGQAQRLSDLARIAESRDDFDGARRAWTEAGELYLRLGMAESLEDVQRELATLPRAASL